VILDVSKAISRKRCKIGGKLVLITNRKSYMSFQLVPKSATLNDLERRNGPYFALFHQIFVYDVVKQLLGLPRDQSLLLIFCDHINTICTIIQRLFWQNEEAVVSTSDCSCLRPCLLISFLYLYSTAGWTGESTLELGLMGR